MTLFEGIHAIWNNIPNSTYILLHLPKTFFYFAVSIRVDVSDRGVGGWADIYLRKTFTWRLSLAYRNLANSLITAKTKQRRCLRDMFIYLWHAFCIKKCAEVLHIGVGYRRCSFQLWWAMREPLYAGRATSTDSRAFSFYIPILSNILNRPVRESAGINVNLDNK